MSQNRTGVCPKRRQVVLSSSRLGGIIFGSNHNFLARCSAAIATPTVPQKSVRLGQRLLQKIC